MGNDSINISSNGGPTQCGRLSTAAPSQIKVWAGVAAGALLAAVVTATVALAIPAAGAICLAAAAVPAVAALILAILAGIRLCQKSENPDKNDESLLTTATESQDPNENGNDYESLFAAIKEQVNNSHTPITLDRGIFDGHNVDAAMLIELVKVFKNKIGVINLADTAIEVNGDDLVRLFGINSSLTIKFTQKTQPKNAVGYDVTGEKITHKRNVSINGKNFIKKFRFDIHNNGDIVCKVERPPLQGESPDDGAGRPEGLSDDAWYKVRDGGLLAAEDGSIASPGDYCDYFHQFAPQDLPIILKHWGHKFKEISLRYYPHTLPPLYFSKCVYVNKINLDWIDTLPELGGLDQCAKLTDFSVAGVKHTKPQCLNALPDNVDLDCLESSLFRKNSQRNGDIDTDQLLQFLKDHPGATVYGLSPVASTFDDSILSKNVQALIDSGILERKGNDGICLA